jgi:PAS domain S-box-containing protein
LAEVALQKSKAELLDVLDATPFPIALVDVQDNKIDFWSRSAHILFGHTAPTSSEWYGLAYPDPGYRQEVIHRWKPFLDVAKKSGKTINTGEYKVTCHDGSVLICELYATFLEDKLMVTFNDITERRRYEEALRLKTFVFDASIAANSISGIDGKLSEVNDAFLRIWGYADKKEVTGIPITDFLLNESDAISIVTALGSIGEWEGDYIGKKKDGSTFIAHALATVVKNDNNQVIGYQSSVIDITDRKFAEEKIIESERMLRESQEIAQLGSYNWNLFTGLWKSSEILDKIFGIDEHYTRSLEGWANIVHPERQSAMNDYVINEVIGKHKQFDKEYQIVRQDDRQIRWVHGLGELMVDSEGKPLSLVGTITDITEQRKNEEEIRLHSEIMNHMAEAVYLVKMIDGSIVFANSQFENLFGYDPGELIGKNVSIVNAPSDKSPEETAREIMESLNENGFWKGEINNIKKDGTLFWSYATVTILDHSQFGEVLVAVHSDITDRKIAEAEIKQLNLQLEHRVIQRTEQLETANKELEAFSYSVSHDLRSPLRAVHSFTNILLEDYEKVLDDEGKRICRIISSGATQMGELIDDLLSFSRIGRSTLNPSMLNMKTLAGGVFADLNNGNADRKIKVKMGKLHSVFGDGNLLKIVWTNLISNAIKYSSHVPSSEIVISSSKEDHTITYSVKDYGVGFDMQYKHKLFGVFQRLHSESEFEGNGVGLAIVQRIIHKHGGKVWAEGEVDKGATFYFSLPASGEGEKGR